MSVKVGMLVRNTVTGLGSQTREIYEQLQPDHTVVVDAGQWAQTPPRDWFPDEPVIEWTRDRRLPGALDLLDRCDVVYSAESFYDPTLSRELDQRGIATVLHVNPELHDPNHSSHWSSTYWTPTRWLPTFTPPGTVVVPMPCPTHRYDEPYVEAPPRIVHPAARAMADRHGTQLVERISRTFADHGWLIDIVGPGYREVHEYWERDPGATLMVLPRRYGGLSLPVLEAFAAGVPVIMPAIPPNEEWPIIPVNAKRGMDLQMKAGIMPVFDTAQSRLLQTITTWMSNPERLANQRKVVYEWARFHSWQKMKPLWEQHLTRALK